MNDGGAADDAGTMQALVFGVDPDPVEYDDTTRNRLLSNLAVTPVGLRAVARPQPLGDDWVVLRTRLAGICGSDAKQVLLDFDDSSDNPMTAFISFPQVLGHEVVATIAEVGADVRDLGVGDRVALNPWLSCRPRGITPLCPSCQAGDFSLCASFTTGRLAAGIHSGNARDATGGFAPYLPAHRSMLIPVPEDLSDEAAVLADPFAVALHAVTRNPPPEGGRALVYGAGALGQSVLAILAALYPSCERAVVARWDAQSALAAPSAHALVTTTEPLAVIEQIAAWSDASLHRAPGTLPMTHPDGVDVVYDSVGSPETIETALRVLRTRGTLVEMGVSSPGRFEWTPWYFKELRLVGSNAFGVESVRGRRQHAIEHYFDLAVAGEVDLTPMVSHRFRLPEWRPAFAALANQAESRAVKVAFDFR